MKKTIGILLILIGILVGSYVSVWIMFVGGIAGLINQFPSIVDNTYVGMYIAKDICKIFFSGMVGYICGVFPVILGFHMFTSK